ncbi:hypothetical protein PYCCODRAFT_1419722 [Trametes coccinea BRFM310]|uniref:Uncharacterized protein n=1 Tax=Trametes coccinea (strain BRFM310) TaxID=1353009 RepID=A0A1Y2I9G3_TRAC3|nr:hypothetical protein PYCCODRAFT_1419722 [Trametes coccinea BRFM310]
MADTDRKIVYSPSPGAYAVIRLAPVEMVKHLGDSEALEQAASLPTKPHLVYLLDEMSLPFPDRPWYRFDICPIATSLRAEDPDKGITSEMCIPIYPNTDHPTGRAPVRPIRPFPYAHCYHWFNLILQVRVRSRPEEFDETEVVKLSSTAQMELIYEWTDDIMRSKQTVKGRNASQNLQAAHGQPAEPSPSSPPTSKLDALPVASPNDAISGRLEYCLAEEQEPEHTDDCASLSSSSSSSNTSEHTENLAGLATLDIFGGTNEDVDVIPLVDLWISDLPEQLKEEDISDPSELLAECDRIVKILKDARVRAYAAMTAQPPSAAGQDVVTLPKRKQPCVFVGLRPAKMWTKMRIRAGRVASRLDKILRLPHLRFWP